MTLPVVNGEVKSKKTRTTNVVRNAGCARSRYTRKSFLINELMNESMN